ncbi:uncharacterized protein LOC141798931 isoform X2 [Halichoeres trimaculatus]|uniref:uncharacterized protein LOC141798931 isoform X2 n=1 Tax=Halichoeres trimaculatus TaxID=147232 RepID=UPI003D9F8419
MEAYTLPVSLTHCFPVINRTHLIWHQSSIQSLLHVSLTGSGHLKRDSQEGQWRRAGLPGRGHSYLFRHGPTVGKRDGQCEEGSDSQVSCSLKIRQIQSRSTMKIHQVVLFVVFFFTAVCSGNDASTYTGVVGGNGTITCYFSTHLFWKFFCRNECKDEDTLIQIDRDSGRSGRYKIKYEREASRGGSLSVTISNLTKVDSGSYQCGLKEESVRRTRNLTITVLDAVPIPGKSSGFIRTLTEGKTFTRRCGKLDYEEWKFFCRGECQKKEDVLLETVKNTSQNGRPSGSKQHCSFSSVYPAPGPHCASGFGAAGCFSGPLLQTEDQERLQYEHRWECRPRTGGGMCCLRELGSVPNR